MPELALRQPECQSRHAGENACVTPDLLARLRTPEGVNALATAAFVDHGDPLAAASALRSVGVEADLAAAALTQVHLRRRAATKFGAAAERMFFTRPGLEQATRAVVADRRAARLAAAGGPNPAHLGRGRGPAAPAAARAGTSGDAGGSDPATPAGAPPHTAPPGPGAAGK